MASPSSSARPSAARRAALLLATAALVPGLAACGGDDADQASTASTSTATTEATEANAVSLTEGMVKQSNTAPVLAVANLVDAMKQFDQSAAASAVSGSFMQDTANLAKAQIAQSAATDMLAKARPDGLAPQGILGMPK